MSLTATEEEDDDHELRDLVSDVLAQNGVLAKIKVITISMVDCSVQKDFKPFPPCRLS